MERTTFRPPPKIPQLCLCAGVDFDSKTIRCKEVFKGTEHEMGYDYLVIATGARNNTFGVPGVHEVGNGLCFFISIDANGNDSVSPGGVLTGIRND